MSARNRQVSSPNQPNSKLNVEAKMESELLAAFQYSGIRIGKHAKWFLEIGVIDRVEKTDMLLNRKFCKQLKTLNSYKQGLAYCYYRL